MKAQNIKPVSVFLSQLLDKEHQSQPQSRGGLVPDDHWQKFTADIEAQGFAAMPKFDVFDGKADGYLILLKQDSVELMENQKEGREAIIRATNYAADVLGAKNIGLGSLTTSITEGGKLVVDACGDKISITHGDSGSVAMLFTLVSRYIEIEHLAMVGNTPRKRIAIVGATGLIGSAIAQMLNMYHCSLILIGRSPKTLNQLAKKLTHPGISLVTTDISDVRDADIVITVTSSTTSLLKPTMVRPGAMVIDPAAPPNVQNEVGWKMREIPVITNACQVRVPGLAVSHKMFGTTPEDDNVPTTYACLAETMLLGVEEEFRQHHVGEIDINFVRHMIDLYKKVDFTHATPRMFGEDIAFFLQSAAE